MDEEPGEPGDEPAYLDRPHLCDGVRPSNRRHHSLVEVLEGESRAFVDDQLDVLGDMFSLLDGDRREARKQAVIIVVEVGDVAHCEDTVIDRERQIRLDDEPPCSILFTFHAVDEIDRFEPCSPDDIVRGIEDPFCRDSLRL